MSKRNPISAEEKERRRKRKARGDKSKEKRRKKGGGRRRRNADEDEMAAHGLNETTYDEIEGAFSWTLDQHANLRAAEGHSYVGDQDQMDAEEEGYQDDTLTKFAFFGSEAAVNSDILVSPGWYEVLDLAPSDHGAQLWTEASSKDGATAAVWVLQKWLTDQGFEEVSRLGGRWPTDESMELQLDHLYDAVARSISVSPEAVEFVAEQEFGESMNGDKTLIYWQPSSGDIEAYALPEGAERVANPFTWADDYPKSAGALGASLGSLVGVALAMLTVPQVVGILSTIGGSLGGYHGVSEDRQVRGAWGGGIGGMFGPVGAAIGGAVAGRKPGEKRKKNPTNELKRKLLR